MKTRLIEHPKRFSAYIFSGIGWLGALYHWADAILTNNLPWNNTKPHPITLGTLLALIIALAGFICAMPDDRQDTGDKKLWALVLFSLIPLVLLGFIAFDPR